nr:TbTX-VI=toxin TsTX-VI homolog [Tityus bahiensis, venom, Peptide Partial, 18 aa] [Tityus bahiensis]
GKEGYPTDKRGCLTCFFT